MKSWTLVALTCFSIAVNTWANCPIPKGKEIQHYLKERDLNPKVTVEVQDILLDKLSAKILHAPLSCGLQGCDYMILVQSSENCLNEALSFSGKYIPLNPGHWDKLEIKLKMSPVDEGKKTPRLYFFNQTTKTYQAIPKPL